ncbi:nucleotidyltransferase domain-containing protein [Candidatus Gottesmanbacteria bacterium]|nr:nucleotidyltransferase domain-containing protein [Candidatus Gottesmanbacteria bacterium]
MSNNLSIINPEVRDELNKYVSVLLNAGIKPDKVILFGSYAKGTPHPYSDIDVAVVSSGFGRDERKEMFLLAKLTRKVSDRIEAIPFEKNYFTKSKYDTLIGEVKKYGKIIYGN